MMNENNILRRTNSDGFHTVTHYNCKDNQEKEKRLSNKNISQIALFKTDAKPKCGRIKLFNNDEGNEFNIIFLERNKNLLTVQTPSLSNENGRSRLNRECYNKNDSSEICNVENSSLSDLSIRNKGINYFQAKFITTLAESQKVLYKNYCINTDNNVDICKVEKENDLQFDKDSILNSKQASNAKHNNHNDKVQLLQSNLIDNNQTDLNQINLFTSNNSLMNSEAKNQNQKEKDAPNVIDATIHKAHNLSHEINIQEIEKDKEYETEFSFPQKQVSHRYKPNDILINKAFFEMRYLNQNLKNISKIANSIKVKEPIIDETNKQKNFYFYVDNRNVMKYTSLFWKKMDTAIFQFNNKQFDKSYKHLKEESIINTLDEFTEVLILIQGFNKSVLGEFLAYDKSPNDKFKVTQIFISKLDMQKEKLISSLRFLLSLFILPNQNWDNIINYFSITYYNDNKYSLSSFKSENEISELCIFGLKINQLRRNTHKIMEWSKFIIQFPDYNSANYEMVFNDIMANPLPLCSSTIVYDEAFINKDNQEALNSLKLPTVINTALSVNNINNNTNTNMTIITLKGAEIKHLSSELMTQLKRGDVFRRRNIKGNFHYKVFSISNDEQSIIVKNKSCSCSLLSGKKIPIDSILHIFLGTCSMTHVGYENHMTILTKNKAFELYNPNNQIILKWYNALSYLIKKSQSLNDLKQKKMNNINKSEYLTILWSEIVKNWEEYRVLFKIKNKQFWLKNQSLVQKAQGKKYHNEPTGLGSVSSLLFASRISKDQIVNLCSLGLPNWIRRDLWKILIGNQLDISETLLAGYIRIIDEEKQLKPNLPITLKISNHIEKLYHKHNGHIDMDEVVFKDNLFKIIRAFCLYRPDVLYSKQVAYFALIFYIWSNDFIEAFISLCNFVVPNCFFKFLIKDEEIANEYSLFYNDLLKKYVPNGYKYLMKFNFHWNVFFAKWAGYLFTT